jgi:hypothetical protein
MPETVEFTEPAVKEFLDACIRHWRDELGKAKRERMKHKIAQAECYVDAYQSVRTSLFRETLP